MKILTTSEIKHISGASLGTFMAEVIVGRIPWGLSHSMQFIDMPTLALGTGVGFLAGVSVTSVYCIHQIGRPMVKANNVVS